MKTLILIGCTLVAFGLAPIAAHASGDTEIDCNGNGSCDFDNSTTNSAAAAASATAAPVTTNVNTAVGGAGGQGGTAIGVGIGKGGEGGDAAVLFSGNSKNDVDVDVDTRNLNLNKNITHVDVDTTDVNIVKGSKQYQGQSQKIKDSGNSSIVWNERRDVASANAAAAVVAACGDKTAGIAAQGPGFGGSLSLPFGSSCEDLATVALIQALGHGDAAVRYLCRENDTFAEDKVCAAALQQE